jgi:hypothetical protein
MARADCSQRTYVPRTTARGSASEPPEGTGALIHAFDCHSIDASLPPEQKRRLSLEALRKRALLHALAGSGAPVNEALRPRTDENPRRLADSLRGLVFLDMRRGLPPPPCWRCASNSKSGSKIPERLRSL